MKKIATSILAILFYFSLNAQGVEPVKNIFQGTRFINLQSANVASKNELQMFIQHRFGDISGGFYELFGLDEASMRLGFEYGLTKNFTIGAGRSSYMKTFDLFLKYRVFAQSGAFPVTLTATASGSAPAIRDVVPKEYNNFGDKSSGNIQLHVARSFKYVGFQVSPGYIGTGYIPVENYSYSFFTLGVGGSAKLSKKVSCNIEYLYRFEEDIDYANPLSVSIDMDTGGHLFQLIISNTQQMFDQAIITNPSGHWAEGSLYFGFNLIRGFNFKQY